MQIKIINSKIIIVIGMKIQIAKFEKHTKISQHRFIIFFVIKILTVCNNTYVHIIKRDSDG